MKCCFLPGRRWLAATLACALLLPQMVRAADDALTGAQTIIVNDTFGDNDRTTQNPPNTLAWWAGGPATSLAVANGGLLLTLSGGRHALAYFPTKSIAVGESIELAFDFRTTSNFVDLASGLRFGLMNTNGNTPLAADSNGSTTVTYVGYAVTTNGAPSAANPTALRERTATTATQLITSLSSYTALSGGSGGPVASFATGSTYRATLFIERIDTDAVRVTARYSGGALPAYEVTTTDPAGAVTSFNTIVLCIGSGTVGGSSTPAVTEITFDNVAVNHYGVPPPTAPTITSQPASATVLLNDAVAFSVVAAGSVPMTYQWYLNDNAIQGANASTLTLTNVQANQAGNYTVKVTNAGGEITSNAAVLTVDSTPIAPTVSLPPFGQTTAAGSNVTLNVRAAGSAPFSYQWRRNGVDLPGQTGASLTLSSIDASKAGAYTVVIANSAGTITSQPAIVTVTNQVTSSTLLNETFSGANFITQSLPGSAHWYSSSTSSTGNLALQSGALLVPAGRHALAYFTEGAAQSLAVGDEVAVTFTVNFSVVGTSAGGLRLGLFNSNGGTRATDGDNASFTNYDGFLATTTGSFPDDNSAMHGAMNFMRRTVGSGVALLSTVSNYTSITSFARNSQSFQTGVNYTFRLAAARPQSGKIRFTFQVTGGSLLPYGFQAETDSTVSAFDSFAILSTSSSGSTFTLDNVVVTHTPAPAAVLPSFLTHPESASVNPGSSVTLTADAIGTPVPTFQWRKGGVAIDGATNASFTIASAQAADAGSYDVVVTNSAGSATSNAATLTVGTPLSALQSWRVTHFGAAEASGNAADLADPDGDGLVNLVEYALDFDPLATDTAAVPAVVTVNNEWVFNYARPVNRADITYVVEVSTDLQQWTTTGVTHEQVVVVGETATWQARYSRASAPNAFFRLRVSPAVAN